MLQGRIPLALIYAIKEMAVMKQETRSLTSAAPKCGNVDVEAVDLHVRNAFASAARNCRTDLRPILGGAYKARITYRRNQESGAAYTSIQCQEDLDTETTIILNRLSYDGSGWRTTGDALLANTAADQARKRQQAAREEIAAECVPESSRVAA